MPTQHDIDTRYQVLRLARKNLTVTSIAEEIGISRSAVYFHLHNLEDDGELEGFLQVYKPRKR